MGENKGVSLTTKLILARKSGDFCAMCCGRLSVESDGGGNPANIGEVAHIAGRVEGSARFDPDMTDDVRNSYENLIYLCCNCHKKIDSNPKNYPVEKLKSIKENHERKHDLCSRDAFREVGFPELQKVTEWANKAKLPLLPTQSRDFSVLKIEDKLKKNDLDTSCRTIISKALGLAVEVSKFIESEARHDSLFPERLKAGFLEEYCKLKKKGISGSELFERMCRFSQRGFERQVEKSAALAVLVHFFETCDVFEK